MYSGGRKSCLVPVLYYPTFSNESRCVFRFTGCHSWSHVRDTVPPCSIATIFDKFLPSYNETIVRIIPKFQYSIFSYNFNLWKIYLSTLYLYFWNLLWIKIFLYTLLWLYTILIEENSFSISVRFKIFLKHKEVVYKKLKIAKPKV